MLTHERLKEVLDYDPETGIFRWKKRTSNRVKVGDIAGGDNMNGYIRMQVDGKRHYAHHLAWLYFYGSLPENELDHKDGDGENNRIENLRDATHAQNSQNQPLRSTNTSGHHGVSWSSARNKWEAYIWKNGKKHNLGLFNDKSSAAAEYLANKERLHEFQPVPRDIS